MKNIGRYAIGAVMLAAPALGATLASTAPANAGISIGIGLGGRYDPCSSFDYRYYHPYQCAYRPGWAWGDGYWITDSFGHRHWHGHRRGHHWGRWNWREHHGHKSHHENHGNHGHDNHGRDSHGHGGHGHHH